MSMHFCALFPSKYPWTIFYKNHFHLLECCGCNVGNVCVLLDCRHVCCGSCWAWELEGSSLVSTVCCNWSQSKVAVFTVGPEDEGLFLPRAFNSWTYTDCAQMTSVDSVHLVCSFSNRILYKKSDLNDGSKLRSKVRQVPLNWICLETFWELNYMSPETCDGHISQACFLNNIEKEILSKF